MCPHQGWNRHLGRMGRCSNQLICPARTLVISQERSPGTGQASPKSLEEKSFPLRHGSPELLTKPAPRNVGQRRPLVTLPRAAEKPLLPIPRPKGPQWASSDPGHSPQGPRSSTRRSLSHLSRVNPTGDPSARLCSARLCWAARLVGPSRGRQARRTAAWRVLPLGARCAESAETRRDALSFWEGNRWGRGGEGPGQTSFPGHQEIGVRGAR